MTGELIGQKFGLVTVTRGDGCAPRNAPRWFAVCECGRGRWFHARLLRRSPPSTHRFCAAPADRWNARSRAREKQS